MLKCLEKQTFCDYNRIMKTIRYSQIVSEVQNLTSACGRMDNKCFELLQNAARDESNPNAEFALNTLVKNARIASECSMPLCQDTGMSVFFVKLGQDVHIEGGLLTDAIDEGVRKGYAQNGYRASVLDPISRVNTKDNTPSIVHLELVEGENLEITFLPKGFGSENMSKLYMLKPSQGIEGVKDCIVQAVKDAGANPCPPIIVGVGIGGTAEKAMEVAKEQLLRPVGTPSDDETLAGMEREVLERINSLKIGAQGFGGKHTALSVQIGKFPTHIAALPVAVNIQCNAMRIAKTVL